ncbi:TIGR03862 family flavoprotein [Zhongshania sp. BJYM1]|uniref:TIGR03862 family flavoprotein n=1 Tax=Zhongshania aquatica TaxID=2965069 RepID=UPI0022B2EC12|nr:TIGR03862 family flavoprotein [Marortus sp. BJYM1]
MSDSAIHLSAVVIGGGPAGLMVAEQLSKAGIIVDLYDAMPTVGRKFLRAGIGGLNLTHNEHWDDFVGRYSNKSSVLKPVLDAFTASNLRNWAAELGVETFVGSSGRVFPVEKKAAPLLRRWLSRLRENGVRIHSRHRWLGWNQQDELLIQGPNSSLTVKADLTFFALGGGSWEALGSDGHWLATFAERGISCAKFRPSNCGFEYPWPTDIKSNFSGTPLKSIAISIQDSNGLEWRQRGDAVIANYGIEGGPVYAVSAPMRDAIEQYGKCTIHWDLDPDRSVEKLQQAMAKRRSKDSLANVLRKQCGLNGNKLALFKALTSKEQMADLDVIPALIKNLPQTFTATRPLDEAISTDGGICFSAVDDKLMLKQLPNTYCVGEMLDWEAPTGGYLLTACYATAVWAANAALGERIKS